MVYGFACGRADVFRGVALHSGFEVGNGCTTGGTTPIAFFSSHGVNDATITYSSGVALRDSFVSINGCTAQSPASAPSGGHACTTYSGCSSGHPVEWCAFSGDHTPRPVDSGQTTSWMPARVWAFFTQF